MYVSECAFKFLDVPFILYTTKVLYSGKLAKVVDVFQYNIVYNSVTASFNFVSKESCNKLKHAG